MVLAHGFCFKMTYKSELIRSMQYLAKFNKANSSGDDALYDFSPVFLFYSIITVWHKVKAFINYLKKCYNYKKVIKLYIISLWSGYYLFFKELKNRLSSKLTFAIFGISFNTFLSIFN